MQSVEHAGLVALDNWPQIPTDRGFNSRAGIPGYVDGVRALGNAVVPQVAEFIGRLIVDAEKMSQIKTLEPTLSVG
jgi:hypothetical protein